MKKTNNKGFSLVELIVVIAIMAVLMVVVGPQLLKNVDKARIQRDNQAIAEIANAAKIAMADEEVYKYVNGLSPKKVEVTFSSGAIVLDDNALENELAEVIGSDLELKYSKYLETATSPVVTITIEGDPERVTVKASKMLKNDGSAEDNSGVITF